MVDYSISAKIGLFSNTFFDQLGRSSSKFDIKAIFLSWMNSNDYVWNGI